MLEERVISLENEIRELKRLGVLRDAIEKDRKEQEAAAKKAADEAVKEAAKTKDGLPPPPPRPEVKPYAPAKD